MYEEAVLGYIPEETTMIAQPEETMKRINENRKEERGNKRKEKKISRAI